MSLLSFYIPEHWENASGGLPWRWRHDSGLSGETTDGRNLPEARDIRLILPGTQVLHTELDLPRRGRWQEALAFALEDQVLAEPEALHVAAGAAMADGRTPVAAIDRVWLAAVLARLQSFGLQAQSAYAESELAIASDDEWTLLISPHSALLISTGNPAVALDDPPADGGPPLLLQALLERRPEQARPQRLRVRLGPDAVTPGRFDAWSTLLGVPVVMGKPWDPDAALEPVPASINLLQGQFAPPRRSNLLPDGLRLGHPALLLLCGSLLVWFAASTLQTLLWTREAHALQARSEAALRRAFPETRVVLDVPLQMRRGLDALQASVGGGGPNELPALLNQIGSVSDNLPATLKQLSFNEGLLKLEWACPDAACAATLRQRLSDPARHAEAVDTVGEPLHVKVQIRTARP